MEYKEVVTERATTNELIKLTEGSQSWLLKRYQGENADIHRDSEKKRLALWAQQGYLVPAIIDDLKLSREVQPYLILQWLNGCSLADYLTASDRPIEKKIQQLKKIIKLIHQRQEYSLMKNCYDFIHHDLNTGNIILVNDDCYYIDFEAQLLPKKYKLTEALAIELAKFIRWSVRDLGSTHLDEIIQLTIKIYTAENPILKLLIKRVHNRKFQFIHRWKNQNKKKNNAEDITKYDLADRFQFFLNKVS